MKKLLLLLLIPNIAIAEYGPQDPYGIVPKPSQMIPPPIEQNLVYQEIQRQYLNNASKNLLLENQRLQQQIYNPQPESNYNPPSNNTSCVYIGNVLVCN